MRKLASIQKIAELSPIPNADAIEVATILGWKVVVKKGDFKVGDPCLYCEIDSLLPERPEFEFLRDKKFRIKTIKLRGCISQGIAFPTSILPEGDYEIGQDVTDILGVKKYEPPIPAELDGDAKGGFPGHTPKTDETRIQASPDLIEEFQGKLCYVSVKIDGSSCTFSNYNGEVDVCGHNWSYKDGKDFFVMDRRPSEEELPAIARIDEKILFCKRRRLTPEEREQDPLGYLSETELKPFALENSPISSLDFAKNERTYLNYEQCDFVKRMGSPIKINTQWQLFHRYKVADIFKKAGNYSIQGEVAGEGIQKNPLGLKGQDFFVFNVFDIDKGRYLDFDQFIGFCNLYGLKTVPILKSNLLFDFTLEELLEMAKGKYEGTKNRREGIVIRPMVETYSQVLCGRLSVKVINNDFLLKNED